MKKYRIYCETDGKYEYFDSLMPREVCPTNSSHTVKAGSLALIGDADSDYKYLRNILMIQVATEGFSNLSLDEKKIASENFAVSKADRDSVHTLEEQIQNGITFHNLSIKARKSREEAAGAEIYNRILSAVDQADILNDTALLIDNYVKFGIEGTLEGDVEGLFDYIESRVGTSYENTGLLSKTYTIEGGLTITQLSEKLIDIFKNGNY